MSLNFNLSIPNSKVPLWQAFVSKHPMRTSKVILSLIADYLGARHE